VCKPFIAHVAHVARVPANFNSNEADYQYSGYFAQHHVDTLIPTMNPVQFLAHRFPGKTEQEYRQHLGNFQISGLKGLQPIGTLSGGQKSRVAFSVLSLQRPHILLLDEVRSHVFVWAA
jgi:ATP-binding cassette, subfamily F, member 3